MNAVWIKPKNIAIAVAIILAFVSGRFSASPDDGDDSEPGLDRKHSAGPRPANRSRHKKLARVNPPGAGSDSITTADQLRAFIKEAGYDNSGALQMALAKMNGGDIAALAADLADAHASSRGRPNWIEVPQIFKRWTEVDPEAALRFAKTSDTKFYRTALRTVITTIAKKDAIYALDEAKQMKDPKFALEVKNQVMLAIAISDPDAWISELLSSHGTTPQRSQSGNPLGNPLGNSVGKWFEKDPAAAIARIKRLPSHFLKNSIPQISSAWASKDPTAALQWAHDLENRWMRNQAITSVVSVIAKKNPEKAIALIKDMPAGARNRALSSIYRTMAATDPMGAVEQALALPKSGDRHTVLEIILSTQNNGYQYWAPNRNSSRYTLEQLQSIVSRLQQGELRDSVYGQMTGYFIDKTPEQTETILSGYPDRARTLIVSRVIQNISNTDPERALQLYNLFPATRPPGHSTYSSLLGSLAGINPDKAMKLALEEKNETQRASHISKVLNQISSHDPVKSAQYIALIDDKKVREQAVSRMANRWGVSDPDAVISWANNLSVDEKHAAISAIIPRLAVYNPQLAIKQYETLVASAGNDTSKQSSLARSASSIASYWSKYDPEAASAWVSTLPDEKVQSYAAKSIVSNWAKQDIEQAGQWVDRMPNGKTRDQGVQSLISKLSSRNPAAAFDWAGTISDDRQRQSSLGSIVRQWQQRDMEKARNAVEQADLTEKEYEYLTKILKP